MGVLGGGGPGGAGLWWWGHQRQLAAAALTLSSAAATPTCQQDVPYSIAIPRAREVGSARQLPLAVAQPAGHAPRTLPPPSTRAHPTTHHHPAQRLRAYFDGANREGARLAATVPELVVMRPRPDWQSLEDDFTFGAFLPFEHQVG